MSVLVFAGSAQFVLVQLLGVGTPGVVLIVTACMVNLRHILYSASIAPSFAHVGSRWKWLLAYLLTDEAYAVSITHYQSQQQQEHEPGPHRHWFYVGAGVALWSMWQISTAAGLLLGAQIPPAIPLDFAIPLTFIALVVPMLQDRAGVVAASVAGVVAIFAATMPFKLDLITATVAGILAGMGVDYMTQRLSDRAR